jgi:D-alanyl-lipoteichoic acid acyltransferase DltB (MBOAT superfamily)
MGFTSQAFLVFLLFFFPIYFYTKNSRSLSSFVIVIASCIFYGWWDWRFLILFGITTCFDYAAALLIFHETNARRRLTLLWLSMTMNLAMLCFFKYFNFFLSNVEALLTPFHVKADGIAISVILPVGISFYTFQSMSYTIDVYRKRIAPSTSLIEFLAYVSFFPHMVAGPIQRATHFLPQFRTVRQFNFDMAMDGFRQIVWGLSKKIVVADNLAPFVDAAFSTPSTTSGPVVFVASIFFAFQIYCDFSGYTDIAIGLAKIMGYDLSRNFAYPYFATNIQEFWRRWHISLTTWFREYVYYPLGGSDTNFSRWIRNVFVVFVLSGIWHGANLTFIVWGALHAVAYIAYITKTRFWAAGAQNGISRLIGWLLTMTIVNVGWIFFRAGSINDAVLMISNLFNIYDWATPGNYPRDGTTIQMFLLIACLMGLEWRFRQWDYPLKLPLLPEWARGTAVIASILLIALLGAQDAATFIYFQF